MFVTITIEVDDDQLTPDFVRHVTRVAREDGWEYDGSAEGAAEYIAIESFAGNYGECVKGMDFKVTKRRP